MSGHSWRDWLRHLLLRKINNRAKVGDVMLSDIPVTNN